MELLKEYPKQALVFNRALNMGAGKLAAQLSHASMGSFLKLFDKKENENNFELNLKMEKGLPIEQWVNQKFTKVVLYVKSEEALLKVYNNAIAKGLNAVLIKDEGLTFFDKPTYTCVGIGPDLPSNLKPVTGKLQVYKD